MKTASTFRIIHVVTTAVLILAIFIIKPASAQEKKTGGEKKTVKLKIVKDVKGEKVIIDTAFVVNSEAEKKELQKYLEGVEKEKEAVEKEMKAMKYEIAISKAEKDGLDSLDTKEVTIFSTEGDGVSGEGFNWHFSSSDVPCLEDIEVMAGKLKLDEGCCEGFPHGMFMHNGSNEPTLSDLLGDIPMSRVTSYTVKDKKGGKRIVIDITDAPFNDPLNKVIIMKNVNRGDNMHEKRGSSKVKVIVTPEGESTPEKKDLNIEKSE